jgi:hypothetical protein
VFDFATVRQLFGTPGEELGELFRTAQRKDPRIAGFARPGGENNGGGFSATKKTKKILWGRSADGRAREKHA